MRIENDKLLSIFGLCKKAGKLGLGRDAVKAAVMSNTAKCIFLAKDASANHEKEFAYLSQTVPLKRLECTMDDFYFAIGKKVGVISVNDENFMKLLKFGG
ncbi:MAG: 50S ribosomal protein L7ae [Oscillospiraceae bacterium]|nr:50S ribosomal protein L7ae [Oscillospiraceae bacterium]